MATIPLFMGGIGWITNWTGIWMLFNPVKFKGVRLLGLKTLAEYLPRKLQQVPGVMHGGIGWQGIIPSRAAKMGSIAVDKGIAKVGGPREFYEQLDADRIAQHILATSTDDIHALVDRTLERDYPHAWRDLPPRAKRMVHDRVQAQLPTLVSEITHKIGDNIDQLLDVKLMVIQHIEARPELANRIFEEVGEKELKFIINFGFVFGFVLGLPVVVIMHYFPYWWLLPILGTLVGWAANWLAIWMIFEPVEEKRILGFRVQGLFLKRQEFAARAYADVIAGEIITVRNFGDQLMNGPRGDLTRTLIEQTLRPVVDRTVGQLRPLVRAAVGMREYDALRDSMAAEGVEFTLTPLQDEDFNREQRERIHALITERMVALPAGDFSEMLRSAMREDEWLLILHGGVLGFAAGLLHLAIFGV